MFPVLLVVYNFDVSIRRPSRFIMVGINYDSFFRLNPGYKEHIWELSLKQTEVKKEHYI